MRNPYVVIILACVTLGPAIASAQTTTPGVGIDVEIVNPVDGSNNFCASVGVPFWAEVWVRPGSHVTMCSLGCGSVTGGTAAIATAAVAVEFDPTKLAFSVAESNPDPSFAAVDGLVTTAGAVAGRVGWTLAGDWIVNGDPASGLAGPCNQQMLDTVDWVFRVQLEATSSGSTLVSFARQPDFALSFADHCAPSAFTVASGDVDEIVPGYVTTNCTGQGEIIFGDGLETGTTERWSQSVN